MLLLLERMRMRKARKLAELERKHLQKICPHEYEVVLSHKNNEGTSYVDIYCPVCEKMRVNLRMWKWNRIDSTQAARESFHGKVERAY